MFRTSYRMSDSLSRATGKVYRRAWRQGLYAGLVFLGAWIGQFWGVTGVAVGVLVALLINYLLMAQLSLSVGQITWLRFFQAQLPALSLTLLTAVAAFAVLAGARHVGLPPVVTLLAGAAAAGGIGLLAAWLAPALTLGPDGMRMRDTLRAQLRSRLRPTAAGGSA
jgi:hypothetical protein